MYMAPADSCSARSQQAGEELAGSAPQVEGYLLLEYNGPWGKKAFETSDLPPEVKAHLSGFLVDHPKVKLVLIKNRAGLLEPGIRFFGANLHESQPSLRAYHLEEYHDLLSLDLATTLQAGEDSRPQPLFLVCVNGRRDACCARFGPSLYTRLLEAGEEDVWQCTHLGGHRFAPVIACLPQGVFYGRVPSEKAVDLLSSHRVGQIELSYYRGRACYPPPVQAAESKLRHQLHCLNWDGLRWLALEKTSPESWRVQFQVGASGDRYRCWVQQKLGVEPIPQSCLAEKLDYPIHWQVMIEKETD